jgi:hypothetical protein
VKNPISVSHLKNSIWVRKGKKESGKLETEDSRLKAERRAKVLGEMILISPDGREMI